MKITQHNVLKNTIFFCCQECFVDVYEGLMEAIEDILKTQRPSFKRGMQDHCWAALNAKKNVFAGISVGNCWPHVSRKVGESLRHRLRDKEMKSAIVEAVCKLHAITDEATFSHAMMLFYEKLDGMKEKVFSDWFRKEYDHDGVWLKWYNGESCLFST